MTEQFEFTSLLYASREVLLHALAETHEELARLHCEIAYARSLETRDNPSVKTQRIMDEGTRDALIEKKFLIVRLLDNSNA